MIGRLQAHSRRKTMKHVLEQVPLLLVVVSMVFVLGCSDDSKGVDPSDRLCRGESGFAAAITGGPTPVEMCVSDQATVANYVPFQDTARYEIRAVFVSDSLTIEVELSFFVQPTPPTTLTLTTNQAQAESDPGAVWIFYRETKLGTYDYVAATVTGVFTVTFNDPSVAVGTFAGVEMALDDVVSGDPVGSRSINEGYVSVTAE